MLLISSFHKRIPFLLRMKNSDSNLNRSAKEPQINEQRRHFLKIAACAIGGVSALCAPIPFISSWMPGTKAKIKALPIQVDISQLKPGEQLTVEWRGKPVWILRRTSEMLQTLIQHNAQLRDPNSLTPQQPAAAQNAYRSINPEYLVVIGICTHLGCTPRLVSEVQKNQGKKIEGFLCPCHGSTFDLAGRVYKDVPAPINLEVPPYYFKTENLIVIGETQA